MKHRKGLGSNFGTPTVLNTMCAVRSGHVLEETQFQYIKQTFMSKIGSEYYQEISQSQTADNPMAPRGRAAQPSRDTRKTN